MEEIQQATGRCAVTCQGVQCHRSPGHDGLLHQTPPSERLRNGTRDFGTIFPPGWHRGDGLDKVRSRWNDRVNALSRMSVARLRPVLLQLHRDLGGGNFVLGGPDCMSKDELIAEILDLEFPREDPSFRPVPPT